MSKKMHMQMSDGNARYVEEHINSRGVMPIMTAGRGREDESPCRSRIGGDSTCRSSLIFLTRCVPIIVVKSIVKRLRDVSVTLRELHMSIQPNSELESTIISGG